MSAGTTPTDTDQQELPLTQADLDQAKAEIKTQADNDRLSTELAETQRRLQSLESAQVQQPQPVAPVPVRVYSSQELDVLVEQGTISSSTKDDILRSQQAISQKADISQQIQQGIAQYRIQDTTERSLEAYKLNYPDAFKEGTELREKVKQAYAHLIKMGDSSDDRRTDIKALYAVVGAPEKIGERTARRTPTHVESGGSGGGGGAAAGSSDSDGVPKPLQNDAKLKYHYDALIKDGTYTGYSDKNLQSEMKYAAKRQAKLVGK